jgi:hypothetical protein
MVAAGITAAAGATGAGGLAGKLMGGKGGVADALGGAAKGALPGGGGGGGPRALATLLVARSSMGILSSVRDGIFWDIHITIGYADREDSNACVDVEEYGRLLRLLLDKQVTFMDVLHVERAK